MENYYSSVLARLRLGMQPFAFFKVYKYTTMFQIKIVLTGVAAIGFQMNKYTHGFQTIKDLLQSQRLLKRSCRCEKLATAANVGEEVAKRWLTKQALWQIYLPAPRYIFGQSLMSHCPMQCIKQTFFFCLTTNSRMEERFTNTL